MAPLSAFYVRHITAILHALWWASICWVAMQLHVRGRWFKCFNRNYFPLDCWQLTRKIKLGSITFLPVPNTFTQYTVWGDTQIILKTVAHKYILLQIRTYYILTMRYYSIAAVVFIYLFIFTVLYKIWGHHGSLV